MVSSLLTMSMSVTIPWPQAQSNSTFRPIKPHQKKIKCTVQIEPLNRPFFKPTTTTVSPPQHSPPRLNIFQKAAAIAIDAAERALISREQNTPLPKTADPSIQIAGNYFPVPESPVRRNLTVEGKIPNCINGVYVRNGANPMFEPIAGHHLFDGDGMVHAVKITNGSASYACRFTKTERLIQEKQLGRPVFPKPIGELHGHSGIARLMLFYARGIFGLINNQNGVGVANAGLVYFNNRLLAMSEDDLPYELKITQTGDLQTIGRYDFNGQLKSAMIAHPKLDPVTKELHALSYDVVSKPYLKYFRFSSNGVKSPELEIPLQTPTMIHDFAITENYIVIPDQQIVFNLGEMITGKSPVVYDSDKVSRLGILSKHATDAKREMIWVDSPEMFCFHLWNAWESPETDEIFVIGSCMSPADSIFNERDERLKIVLSEIRINLKTRDVQRRALLVNEEEVNLEIGMVNRNRLGKKTRFAFLAIADPWPKVSGFAKVDLFTGEMVKYVYGGENYGGEPFFLPNGDGENEDDGFIFCHVYDEEKETSELRIINAVNLKLEATVKLPSRVPYGFHGTFVESSDLVNQL